jgi:signal transduction histidine kinase
MSRSIGRAGAAPRFRDRIPKRHLWFGAASLVVSAVVACLYLLQNADATMPLWGYRSDDLILAITFSVNLLTGVTLVGAARREIRSDQQRNLAEQQVLERERQLRTILQQMPAAVCVMTSAHEVVLLNDNYRKLFSNANAPHLTVHTDFDAFSPSGERYTVDRWPCRRALRTGEIVHGEDMLLSVGNGDRVWLSVSAAPTPSSTGAPSSVVIVFSDITSRRFIEEANANALKAIMRAQESERLRIARELHDELGQDLTALSIGLKGLEATALDADRKGRLAGFRRTVEMLSRHVRAITTELRPLVLADFGLRKALAELAEGWGERLDIDVDVHLDDLPERLPESSELVAYRVVQEALTNVAKHANAHSISLTARLSDGQLRIVIEDDGLGFAPSTQSPDEAHHFGLTGILERLLTVGGTLEVESSPGFGTTLFVNLPILEEAADGRALYRLSH